MKTFLRMIVLGAALTSSVALAAGEYKEPRQMDWPFAGPLGRVDEVAAQRGFQVYKEVCAACHGIKRVPFRRLADIGFSEAEIKAIAADYTVMDGPNDDGEMFERPARPSDKFPSPYANEKAARAIHGGAYPVDQSLIVKARKDGANYVYSLLTGYQEAPEGFAVPDGAHYNPYFPGKVIKMANPLNDGQVTYQDGTEATVDQMAYDVVNFLQWAGEPEMQERKSMGMKVLIFLSIMTVFFYLAKKRIWKDVK